MTHKLTRNKPKADTAEVKAARLANDIAISRQAEREARAIRGAFKPTRSPRREVHTRKDQR
ncbi:MAG: hypothetical protein AAGG38_07345 [Planctomycetota bacterium]